MAKQLFLFFGGLALGLILGGAIFWAFLKADFISERECSAGFEESMKKITLNLEGNKNWSLQPVVCALPVTDNNCRIKVFRLCNKSYAKAMMEDESCRKIASVIPCQFALYEKQDGKTYLSRQDMSLAGRLVGGPAAVLFDNQIKTDQEKILSGVLK
jgi:hypothetical protein